MIRRNFPPPDRIRVGPYRFAVIFDEAALNRKRIEDKTIHSGECSVRTQTIMVDPTVAPDYAAEVLLHEVLHAVFFASGIEAEKMTEEEAVCALSPGLLDTLRRNPRLVNYLIHEGESP